MTFRRAIMQNNFDSVLDPAQAGQPAKLTIRLKVALFPRDPTAPGAAGGVQHPVHLADSLAHVRHGYIADYNRHPIACRSWVVPEWNAFKIRFKQAAELAWNNQMYLLPPDADAGDGGLNDADYRLLVGNPWTPAHVECALDIELMPIATGSHAQIEVVHVARPGLDFRDWMHRISDDSVQFTVRHKDRWPSTSLYQFVAAHEVGHWLHDLSTKLFEHVDAAYSKTRPLAERGDAQYGHVLGKRMAMMGSGSLLTEHEAQPWLGRIRQHIGSSGWTTVHRLHFHNDRDFVTARQQQLTGNSRP